MGNLLLPLAAVMFVLVIVFMAMNLHPGIVVIPLIIGWLLVFADHKVN